MKELQKYERPNLEIIEFFVEQGFNASMVPTENAGEGNGSDKNETWGWDDEN